MEVLLDASAIMAVIADEPEREIVIQNTLNSEIDSPKIISYEISNGLTRMMRKNIIDTQERMINLIQNFKMIPIKTVEVDIEKALKIAWEYKIYAYDAFYLEVGKRLKIPMLTFDKGMKRVGKALGLLML
jgi:predicted nucleic acid-binding protein